MTGADHVDAQQAFSRMVRSRRRAALARRLRRQRGDDALPVFDGRDGGAARSGGGIREIPLDEIRATLEPSRAKLFDRCFRPAAGARQRWQRVWLAEHRGAALPPVSLVATGDGYAIRDGHHRVSVARARGALMIDATVDTAVQLAL